MNSKFKTMSFDFSKIKYELEVDGFSVLSPTNETIAIATAVSHKFSPQFVRAQDQEYKVNIFRRGDLQRKENLDIHEYNKYCQNIIPSITTKRFQLDSVFQTYDTSFSEHIAQNPHFDRIPTLKFMLYVNDLTHQSGAFCLSPGSHHWVKHHLGLIRPSHGTKGYLELSRDIPQYIRDRIVPVEGKLGTIILFNTDCIHHQGLVTHGMACILRAHYRTNILNQLSISELLKNF